MKQGFFEKLLHRVQRMGNEDLQAHFIRLAQDKTFLETIFNTLQEGVVVLDAQGRIEYFNRSASRILSLPDGDVLHAPISRFLKEVDWQELLRSGMSARRVLEIQYPERRWVEFYLVAMKENESSARRSFALIFHDVTQAQTQTQEYVESERLQAITMLAAGVAHELGNPLNSLHIHLQLMERDVRKLAGKEAERLMESIDIARSEIDRLDAIIHQFLKAIRPSQPQLQQLHLATMADETLELLKLEIADRDVLIEREYDSTVPAVMLDGDQVKQAFYNIIRNALQAMHKGGILRVRIDCADSWAQVSFIDSGQGIAPEHLPQVTQPFFTTKQSGHGLGLLIVQRITREHGGEMEIQSEQGRGTTVRLKFPTLQRRIHLLQDASPSTLTAQP